MFQPRESAGDAALPFRRQNRLQLARRAAAGEQRQNPRRSALLLVAVPHGANRQIGSERAADHRRARSAARTAAAPAWRSRSAATRRLAADPRGAPARSGTSRSVDAGIAATTSSRRAARVRTPRSSIVTRTRVRVRTMRARRFRGGAAAEGLASMPRQAIVAVFNLNIRSAPGGRRRKLLDQHEERQVLRDRRERSRATPSTPPPAPAAAPPVRATPHRPARERRGDCGVPALARGPIVRDLGPQPLRRDRECLRRLADAAAAGHWRRDRRTPTRCAGSGPRSRSDASSRTPCCSSSIRSAPASACWPSEKPSRSSTPARRRGPALRPP